MTRGTVARQRAIGALGLVPPEVLAAKIAALSVTAACPRIPAQAGAASSTGAPDDHAAPAFAGVTERAL